MSESLYTPPRAQIEPTLDPDRQIMERPREVLLAIILFGATYVVGAVALFFTWDYQMSLQAPGPFLFGQAFGTAIAIWVQYKIFCGRNWARILYLVFALLGLLALLIPGVLDEVSAAPMLSKVVMVFGHSVTVAVIWLLFFSPGRHWFNKQRREVAA